MIANFTLAQLFVTLPMLPSIRTLEECVRATSTARLLAIAAPAIYVCSL